MGRKLEFDKNDAMQRAMESFWAKGYDATSMRDLAGKLGLHLGSVYNALGDKAKVFEEALRLHFESHMAPALKELAASPDPLETLRQMFDSIIDECGMGKDKPGCFLINSLLDINDINDSISQTLKNYLAEMERHFAICIQRGIDQGQILPQNTAEKYAHFMISTCFTLRTMAKLGMPREYLSDIASCALSALNPAAMEMKKAAC